MSLATVYSRGLAGVDAPLVTVEAHLGPGLPSFTIVGLPDTEVKEARERVRAALAECGYTVPSRRITVNLAPADLPKESGRFDLAIALAILAASGQIEHAPLDRYEFAGELSLTGKLRPIRGALAMAHRAAAAGRWFVLPRANSAEATLVRAATVLPADSLLQVCAHLLGHQSLHPLKGETPAAPALVSDAYPDLADVIGQAHAKRALEIAAAGGHALLMIGPPGTGKSMLAQRLPGLLPPMTESEAMENVSIHSLTASGFRLESWGQRPYRAPHHSASSVALVGGGSIPRPGEISLANHGVLFLDELAEFDRKVLEMLREPLESGRIEISRASRQSQLPARFQLVAAMNPCPCGFLGDNRVHCRCTPDRIERYRRRISGPLLDRIDMQIEVPALDDEALLGTGRGEPSASVRARVERAHKRQLERQANRNAWLNAAEVALHCRLDREGEALVRRAVHRLALSARALHRVLKVARSIADLGGSEPVDAAHVAEAIHYRNLPIPTA